MKKINLSKNDKTVTFLVFLTLFFSFTGSLFAKEVPTFDLDTSQLPTVKALEVIDPSLASIEVVENRYGISMSGTFTRTVGINGFPGVVISPDGFVVTTAKNMEDALRINVIIENKRYTASLVGSDKFNDVALLKVNNPDTLFEAASFADSDKLTQGQTVIAVGRPLPNQQAATRGIVSALRDYFLPNGYLMPNMIQTDAHNFTFNRGGPLIDLTGKIIGLMSFSVQENQGTPQYLSTSVLDLNFATPSNIVWESVYKMMQGEEVFHPWVGLGLRPLDDTLAIYANIPEEYLGKSGVMIQDVDPNSPASRQGLSRGDIILGMTRVRRLYNGEENTSEEIVSTPLELAGLIRDSHPQDTLGFVVLRSGEVEEFLMSPEDRPVEALPGTV
ncbi:hypothetical protein CL645_06250 [bacterium]|nr:hypothetical protein [bacterium]MBD62429.1 hypothetical protein [bacterium]|tara:strand:+ start:2387 stop:3550 length:1164 start_codon:yes stop_codon:yes gene_type:complete